MLFARYITNQSEQGYILRLKDGEVVIYRKDEKEPFEKTGLKEEKFIQAG